MSILQQKSEHATIANQMKKIAGIKDVPALLTPWAEKHGFSRNGEGRQFTKRRLVPAHVLR